MTAQLKTGYRSRLSLIDDRQEKQKQNKKKKEPGEIDMVMKKSKAIISWDKWQLQFGLESDFFHRDQQDARFRNPREWTELLRDRTNDIEGDSE